MPVTAQSASTEHGTRRQRQIRRGTSKDREECSERVTFGASKRERLADRHRGGRGWGRLSRHIAASRVSCHRRVVPPSGLLRATSSSAAPEFSLRRDSSRRTPYAFHRESIFRRARRMPPAAAVLVRSLACRPPYYRCARYKQIPRGIVVTSRSLAAELRFCLAGTTHLGREWTISPDDLCRTFVLRNVGISDVGSDSRHNACTQTRNSLPPASSPSVTKSLTLTSKDERESAENHPTRDRGW